MSFLDRLPTLESLPPLEGKRVFLRVDYNVPIVDGAVLDRWRIEASLPTLRALKDKGARVIVASHLGRPPKGRRDPQFSLEPIGAVLAEYLDSDVLFAHDVIGDGPHVLAQNLWPAQVLLLENLRFHPGEEANDPQFAKELAALADLYVNDAFGASHRAHASVAAIVDSFRHSATQRGANVYRFAAGQLLERELRYVGGLLTRADRPFVLLLGGAKVVDKVGVVEHLVASVDSILVGGAMALSFLRDEPAAARVRETARRARIPIVLPTDYVKEDGSTIASSAVTPDMKCLDIGKETVKAFIHEVEGARTVFWNGPLGKFETKGFETGTFEVAAALAALRERTRVVVGGGDSAAAVRACGCADRMAHVSTGGGAALELLEGKALPAVTALLGKA